ncbi:MAG: DMT family transporter [Gammaproteobacteria bacterium]|nr:DMT family transporter [Gammaproteobacteria bacterium]
MNKLTPITPSTFVAFVWMLGALTSFSLVAIAGRELGDTLPISEILVFRSIIGLIIISLIIYLARDVNPLKTQRFGLHCVRNTFHFAGQYAWFLGITLLPLAQVFALEFTVPIWTAIVAAIFLKDHISRRQWMAIALGFIGVVIIIQPGTQMINPPAFIVLLAAMSYAVAHTSSKSLTKTESANTIVFYMCLIQLPMGLFLNYGHWVTPVTSDWLWIIIVSITALSAHFCMTKAMQYAAVTTVVIIDYLRLPLITVVGILFYEETPSLGLIIGSAILIGSNIINIRDQQKNH